MHVPLVQGSNNSYDAVIHTSTGKRQSHSALETRDIVFEHYLFLDVQPQLCPPFDGSESGRSN